MQLSHYYITSTRNQLLDIAQCFTWIKNRQQICHRPMNEFHRLLRCRKPECLRKCEKIQFFRVFVNKKLECLKYLEI
jgi:hypothetical protein